MVTTRGYLKHAVKTRYESPERLNFNQNESYTPKEPGAALENYDCADDDWIRMLNHGVDQLDLTQATWSPRLTNCGCGEMTLGGLETSTLTTSIHPLYQPDRWILEKFPKQEDVCRLVQPAVKLASEVLETKPVMSFFRRIMYIILRKKGGRTCLDREEPEETNEQDVAVQQALVARAKHLRILFGVIDLNYCSKTQAHGITLVSQKWFAEKVFIRGNVDKLPADDYKTHYIVINQAYIDYAKRQRPSASAAVRFIFSLAFTIVHETGHVLYCRNFDDGNEDYNEPYFDLDQHINDEKDGELGYALENVLFKDVGNPSFIKKPALTSNGIR